ncbi:glycosyltransferase family 4 protein [Rhodobacteraceae bacterium NNCM2]|nr:glycosyltransferase family 4 protein [Coraliihabitans acroporae]
MASRTIHDTGRGDAAPGGAGHTPLRILHFSGDFPDPLAPNKTSAIRNLIQLVPEHEHRVYSLNRVGWRHGVGAVAFGEGNRAVTYGAPPKGIALAGRLSTVADFVLEDLTQTVFKPDIVHAHKLSIEGLVGEVVARALNLPLIISSQGNTDLKIIRARPDLRRRWGRIWQTAAVALPFAPWTSEGLNRLLGARSAPIAFLPCPTPQDVIRAPRATPPILRSAFHLAGHANKNAAALMQATVEAAKKVPDVRLEIIGGGDPKAFAKLSDLAQSLDANRITLIGARPHEQMPDLFNTAAAMPMPSRRESFGMALVEALFAGCPVLHSRNTAIDGYLPPGEVSIAVESRDQAEISAGVERLVREQDAFKERLAKFQENGGLAQFQRASIAATYREALATAANSARTE